MRQTLLFIAAMAAMFSIVPLAIWAATGRLRDSWEAFKGYMICIGILAALSLFGVVSMLIGSIP
jgi:hypothetical protein